MTERRRDPRIAWRGVRARVRPGHRLAVVDISGSGALVEGPCALRPGARVEVLLERDGRGDRIGAQVTRCSVASIDPEKGMTYRSALSFNEIYDWVREEATRSGYVLHGTYGERAGAPDECEQQLPRLEEAHQK